MINAATDVCLDPLLLARLTDPVVRDLAWALLSPPLLNATHTDPIWPDRDWYCQLFGDYRLRLAELDRHPDTLHRAVLSVRGKRLGHYFEALWQYWLNDNERYELRHSNLQIQDAGTTLGELDCIVYDRQTDELQHWELALKFYLGCGDLQNPANWIGPGASDRLDLKLTRLLQHQLPLTRHPASIKYLAYTAMPIARQHIILKGRLFHPVQNGAIPQSQSWWCALEDFRRVFTGKPLTWIRLARTDWLAPLRRGDAMPAVTAMDMVRQLESTEFSQPICVAGFTDTDEFTRGFIVPAQWPAFTAADEA